MNEPQFKQFLVFLFFVFLSLVFWLMQSMQSPREKRFVLPVRLVGVPEGVVVTEELPRQLEFVLRDKGWKLASYAYQTKLRPIEIDFGAKEKNTEAGHVALAPEEVMEMLGEQLQPTTTVADVEPDTLEYYYTRQPSRRVPVRVRGAIATTPQHYLVQVAATPDSVDVYAMPGVLDTIRGAHTEALEWPGLTDTREDSVGLLRPRGVKFVPATVGVRASVGYFVEKFVDLPVRGVNFPPDKVLRAFPSKVRLTFRVGESTSARDWASLFEVTIDYNELAKERHTRVCPQITTQPRGVDNVRMQPQVVDYLIEYKPAPSRK